MKLKLKTNKDKSKFYNRLWLYKSFWFKFTSFETSDKVDEELKNIIKALNIKNRKERINFIYECALDQLDGKYKGVNICGFNGRICYSQACKKNPVNDGCCRKCLYVTPKGCPSRNVSCKLFNCTHVKKRYDMVTYKDIKYLKLLNLRQRSIIRHDYFTLKEDALKDLYSRSIIYAFFRISTRNIINLIKKNKKDKKNTLL